MSFCTAVHRPALAWQRQAWHEWEVGLQRQPQVLAHVRSFTEAAEECIEDDSISASSVGALLRQRFDKVCDMGFLLLHRCASIRGPKALAAVMQPL